MAAFESWVGRRYVRSRSSNGFVSMISTISMLGIAIAVAVLILVLSVVNGFERELKDRLLAMSAHANIENAAGRLDQWQRRVSQAEENPRVTAAAPYVDGQALLVFGDQLSGAELRGIEPALEDKVSGVSKVLTEGDLQDLRPGSFKIILGVELAETLNARVLATR